MHKIVTLDPGGTTGYCFAVHEDPNNILLTYGEKRLDVRQFNDMLISLKPDFLICEDFEYRNRARPGLDLTPVKLIGIVELYTHSWKYGDRQKVFFQNAAQGKGHYSNEKLEELGIYKKGVNHGRDACRHFMQWLTFGPGYSLIQDHEPVLQLVEENWLLGAYWQYANPWK